MPSLKGNRGHLIWKLLWMPMIFIFACQLLQFDEWGEKMKESTPDHQIAKQKPILPQNQVEPLSESTSFNSARFLLKGKQQQNIDTFFPIHPFIF